MSRNVLFAFAALVVVFMPVLISAQDEAAKSGVLTGDKVRVRVGPSTSHKILLELGKGTKVTVVGKDGNWCKIRMPSEVILWVSKNYIKMVEGGGEVTGDKVNVRTGTEASDIVVGQVSKGDKLSIVGTKGGWYKIRPPEGFVAYMSAQFVRLEGTAGDVTQSPERVEPENGKTPEDAYQRRLEKLQDQISILTQEAKELQQLLDEKREKEKELEKKLRKADSIIKGYEEAKDELERKYERLLEEIETGKPKAKYTAEGYVEDFGKLIDAPPATHCLYVTPGSEPRYYIKSADESIDLDNYLRKRVGVEGDIVKEKWGGKEIEVIKVVRIAILED